MRRRTESRCVLPAGSSVPPTGPQSVVAQKSNQLLNAGSLCNEGTKVTPGLYTRNMSNPKFETGDRVQNVKNKRIGFVKKQRSESVYLVSVQGFGEREWNEADMVK